MDRLSDVASYPAPDDANQPEATHDEAIASELDGVVVGDLILPAVEWNAQRVVRKDFVPGNCDGSARKLRRVNGSA